MTKRRIFGDVLFEWYLLRCVRDIKEEPFDYYGSLASMLEDSGWTLNDFLLEIFRRKCHAKMRGVHVA